MEKDTLYDFYRDLELKDYLEVLRRRKRVIVYCFISFILVAGIHNLIATPIYRATTRLLIERETPQVFTIEELYAVGGPATDYYQTQYKVLRSRSLAERVVKKLNLTVSPRFRKGDPAQVLLGMIEIEPIRNSRLVDIHSYSDNPQLAATVANAFADEYIKKNLDDKYGASRKAVEWLGSEIEELRLRMEGSERKLQEYKEKNQLVSLEESQNIVVQKLGELNSKATDAKAARLTAEAKYRQIEELENVVGGLETLPAVRDSLLIRGLKTSHAEKEGELSELLRRYKEKHPRIIELRSELEALEARIDVEIFKIVSSIRTEYEAERANEEAILLALAEQETTALQLNRMAIEYNVLKREAETDRDVFESYLKKMRETDVTRELKTSNIRIVDAAKVPRGPVRPNKSRNLLLACLLGLFGGTGLAFAFEYMDDSIRNQKDIEAFIHAPFLGYVPVAKAKPIDVGLYSHKHPSSEIGEALRSIKTNINFILTTPSPHTLLVVSAVPQEGKTSVTANLGIIFAQSGHRVLLVDCDMRHPSLHKIFKLDNSMGLRDYLSDMKDIPTVIQQTSIKNLSVITCGPIPHNPMELLDSPQMIRLLKEARGTFDKVILDSPPVIAVSDALILAKLADGIIQVVRGRKTPREIALEGKSKFDAIGFKLLGTILNNINLRREKYYYTYYYYHGEKVRKRKGREAPEEVAEAEGLPTKQEDRREATVAGEPAAPLEIERSPAQETDSGERAAVEEPFEKPPPDLPAKTEVSGEGVQEPPAVEQTEQEQKKGGPRRDKKRKKA